jgi:hypothetical protein
MTERDIFTLANEMRLAWTHLPGKEQAQAILEFARRIAQIECEECAKICELYQLDFAAAAIRKRGKQHAGAAAESLPQ